MNTVDRYNHSVINAPVCEYSTCFYSLYLKLVWLTNSRTHFLFRCELWTAVFFCPFYLHFASIHNRHTRQDIGNNQTFTNTITKQEQKSTGWYNVTVKQQHITSGWGSYFINHYDTVCLICIHGTEIQVLSCSAHKRWTDKITTFFWHDNQFGQ